MMIKPRDLEVNKIRRSVEGEPSFDALTTAIVAEKWEEYLAAEAEKARRQKEAELVCIVNRITRYYEIDVLTGRNYAFYRKPLRKLTGNPKKPRKS